MNTFQITVSRDAKTRTTIQASRILAQAKALRKGAQGVQVVAVYEMSNEQFFFFVYRAKSPRSPRRSWKLVNYAGVNDGRQYSGSGKGPLKLQAFLERQAYHVQGDWKIRYPHKKAQFTRRFEQVGNPFENGVKQTIIPGSTFIIAEWKATGRKPSKYREATLTVPKPSYIKGETNERE